MSYDPDSRRPDSLCSDRAREILVKLSRFMEKHIYPSESVHASQLRNASQRFQPLPVVEALKVQAKAESLWNLFIPPDYAEYSEHQGLSYVDYFVLAECMGRVIWAPEVFNCQAPDTGNMEVLMKYGNQSQKERWLKPLLAGEIRSSYAMTEPQVASSDASNIELSMRLDGDEWVLDGRKWFITGAMHDRTRLLIVMGKSDPDNPDRHKQQTQLLVPADTPGLSAVRPLTTLGYDDAPTGHAELNFDDVRVPADSVLLGPGRGFEIAQGRLAPGRMHHCMRLIGVAQRALELTCKRVAERTTFGRPLSKHQSVREDISRIFSEIQMGRLLVWKTCCQIDQHGVDASLAMIAATKTTIPLMVQTVLDRCIQMHGAAGLTSDFFMAEAFSYARWCRLADGPDQVHQMALGKRIIEQYS